MSNARHWAREYFTDHPSYNRGRTNERPPEVWANKYQDKIRVICTLCLQDAIGAIATNEEARASSGENLIPRSNSDIKLSRKSCLNCDVSNTVLTLPDPSVFNAPPESEHIWIEARGSTMITHLIHACRLQPRDVVARVVARATHEHPEGNTSKRASSLQHATSSAHHQTRQFIQTPSNEIVSPQPRQTARGQQATVQCDGWTGGDNHHLVAFMATTATKVYTVKVYDTTIERKTAENLLVQMREVLKTLERDWEVKATAFTSDASGESRKARRLLREERPDLVTPDCYAHQINLIVGDYFKTNEVDFLRYATKANELITWIRSKTALIGLIKKYRESRNKQPLSVIWPVPTRWTAFFLAYRRLLELRPTLLDIFQDQRNDNPEIAALIPRDRAGREKAEAMIKLMDDALFWHALARIKSHLSPLAIAANITQSAHCRLDEVLLTFAALYITYLSLSDAEDREVKASLLESIERRWDQSDQEVFIAAVIINPFLRTSPFKKDATLISTGAVYQLFSNLWKRFYNEDPPESLYEETGDYLRGTGCFSTLDSVITAFKNRAKAKEETPSPLDLYSDITIPNQPPCPLIKLALHLLYICPNSASCERLFSTFGLILTKLRTRLDSQRVVGLAECKLHLRDQSLSMETRKNLRRRVFGAPAELQAQQNRATSTAPPMETDQTNATGTQLQSNSRSAELSSEPAESSASTFAPPSVSAALRNLTAKHIALLADHDAAANMFEDSESPRFRASSSGGSYKKRTMSDLFDFTSNSWVSFQQASASGCVEDEMKLYELLDLDADGEFDYDLDDSMDSILTV
ncbi:ribonuclease H-like domain-containing protein [Panaeolus papilionaceus]|nr:ribonuclease H-like domain-containing protein [Panaeolus papilionaceus]